MNDLTFFKSQNHCTRMYLLVFLVNSYKTPGTSVQPVYTESPGLQEKEKLMVNQFCPYG
jgi:hypothetical protein